MVSVNVVCAETESEARSLFKSYELFLAAGDKLGALPSLETALNFPLPRYSPQINLNIVGDPNQVKREILNVAKSYNADEVMVVSPIYDFEARKKSFQLIAEAMEKGNE